MPLYCFVNMNLINIVHTEVLMRIINLAGILLIVLLIMVSCDKVVNDNEVPKPTDKLTVSELSKSEGNSISEDKHITATIDTNLTVNADIIVPKANKYYQYNVIGKQFDADKFTSLLIKDREVNKTAKEEISNPFMKEIITSSNNEELIIWNSSLRYQRDKRIGNIHYLINSKYRYEIENKTFLVKDLDKIAQNEIVSKNIEGLEDAYNKDVNERFKLLTVVEVTADDLIKEQNELSKRPGYEAEIESGMKESIEDWNGIGTLYYLEYCITRGDIPLFGKKEAFIQSSISGMFYQNSYLSVIVSDNGIEYLDIQGAWDIMKESEISLISVESAIEKLKDKYSNEIISSKSEIDKIWLQYMFVADVNDETNNSGVLTPYWCFQRSYIDGEDLEGNKYYYYEADRINAVTGGDLAYGK